MTWYAILYNQVSDSVIEAATLGDTESIPAQFFQQVKINGELRLFYVQVYLNGGLKRCEWHKKHEQWFFAEYLPDVVKLTRMLLE